MAVHLIVITMRFSIIQRVGAVPMSIAGIAKEVATISASALLFGDELTPLNITGVAVTVCGKSARRFCWHRLCVAPCLCLDLSKFTTFL
jgi:solute carrier family 35 protein C2